MALSKTIATDFGVPANYHKIRVLQVDWAERAAVVVLDSFVNEELRRENKKPIATVTLRIDGDKFPFTDVDPSREAAYRAVQGMDGWEDAIDC